jgi:hypothetical protein
MSDNENGTKKMSAKNENGAQNMSEDTESDSGSNASSASGSPKKEIPSIRSTNFSRSKVSHSFSVPLNLFSITRSDHQTNLTPILDQASMSAAK